VIHNSGIANNSYLLKSADHARGKPGERLVVDEKYYIHIMDTVKAFAGNIMMGVEKTYGGEAEL
jgi:hypothetical protein